MERAGHQAGDMGLVGLARAPTSPVQTGGSLGSPGIEEKESSGSGMGEGAFPNVAEHPAGSIHGCSHPCWDAQELGTGAASSPAGSAALLGPGEDAAGLRAAHPPAGQLRRGAATTPAPGQTQPSATCPTSDQPQERPATLTTGGGTTAYSPQQHPAEHGWRMPNPSSGGLRQPAAQEPGLAAAWEGTCI